MGYTLRLLSLKCIQAQEADGDEIYAKLNGEIIFSWSRLGLKFYSAIKTEKHTNDFDFQSCQYATSTGVAATTAYAPEDFEFADLEGEQIFELWESDEEEFLRGDDDFLGEVVISESTLGEQTVKFTLEGADYELRFIVTQ